MNEAPDNARVRFPPPLIYLAALLLGIFVGRALKLPGYGIDPAARDILGWLVVAAGIVVNFAGAGMFRHAGTAIIPFKPASSLVTSGIYRLTRNPMYLGMALLQAGVALLFDSLLALILVPVAMALIQTQVIAREEAYLERAFGDEYRAYKARVRRWI